MQGRRALGARPGAALARAHAHACAGTAGTHGQKYGPRRPPRQPGHTAQPGRASSGRTCGLGRLLMERAAERQHRGGEPRGARATMHACQYLRPTNRARACLQLGKAFLTVRGFAGWIGCGYLNVETASRLGDACAVYSGVRDSSEKCQPLSVNLSSGWSFGKEGPCQQIASRGNRWPATFTSAALSTSIVLRRCAIGGGPAARAVPPLWRVGTSAHSVLRHRFPPMKTC